MKDLYEIIESCKKNKQKAQEILYRKYADKMFGICLRYSRNYVEAEDNFQDGFVIVFEKIRSFKHKGSFEGWMRKVFVNTIFQNFKKNKRLFFENNIEIMGYKQNAISGTDIPIEKLLQFIQELSPRYRMTFNLYALDQYSHKKIAAVMGISEGTSKSNYARARTILQGKINAYLMNK